MIHDEPGKIDEDQRSVEQTGNDPALELMSFVPWFSLSPFFLHIIHVFLTGTCIQ